jgi:hypothetical protein
VNAQDIEASVPGEFTGFQRQILVDLDLHAVSRWGKSMKRSRASSAP